MDLYRRIPCIVALVFAPAATQAQRGGLKSIDFRVETVVGDFQRDWYRAWERSEADRHPLRRQLVADVPDLHCHAGAAVAEWPVDEAGVVGWQIKSALTEFAVCPVWAFRSASKIIDELAGIDAAISPSRLPAVREARSRLIADLESMSLSAPGSILAHEQLVRFAHDQHDHLTAIAAAERCGAPVARCAALRVFAHIGAGDTASAQHLLALARVPIPSRTCEDLMLGALLIEPERTAWSRLRCEDRREIDARAWWIADPLWSDAVSHRRLEQVIRTTLVRLRSAFERDERFRWQGGLGSDARERMLLRYGWPSYMYWSSTETDTEHSSWLASPNRRRSPSNEPYVSYEYRAPRMALVPRVADLRNMYEADPSAWAVRALKAGDPWTTEHVPLSFDLRELEPSQAAALRRQDSALVIVATEISPITSGRAMTSSTDVLMMLGADEPDTKLVAKSTATVGTTAVMKTMQAVRPVMASIEIPADTITGAPAARTRFGIRLPAPLSAMKPGEIAISAPVLLKPMASVDLVPSHPDSALERMSGSIALPPLGKLGIYWETYGIALTDTVDVAVWIAKTDEPGLLRRVGRAMRIVPGAETPVGVSWREPLSARSATLISEGPVPIIGRGLALDLTQLTPGEYWLEVAVARPDQEPVRGRRNFRVLPPN
jgi:hypothetical protein